MSARFELDPLRPVYTLVGDESYVRDRFRRELRARVPSSTLELGWIEADLGESPLEAILDGARCPSLMTPLQVYWLCSARDLFSRGGGAAEDAAPAGKKRHGNFPANLLAFAARAEAPSAVLVFVADHIHIPAERARISLDDRSRLQRLEATLGAAGPLLWCARPNETQAAALAQQMALELGCQLDPALARLLSGRCAANLASMQREIEKLALYTGAGPIAGEAFAALACGGAAASAYDLAQRIARQDRAGALLALAHWWREEGEAGAIGLVFQLSRAFAMALICREESVRDRGALYRLLPEGLRPPGFAADDVLALAQHMNAPALRRTLPRLHRADVELRSSPPSVPLVLERAVMDLCA